MLDENSKGTKEHSCKLVKSRCTRDIPKYFFSNKVTNRWNLLEQLLASMHSSLDYRDKWTTGWAFSQTSLLSPRPYWLDNLPVRLRKVYHKVYQATN